MVTFLEDERKVETITDDDSGGGLFGSDPMISLNTPVAGYERNYYYLRVEDNWFGVGGYFLRAKTASEQY